MTIAAPVPLALCGVGRFATRRILPALVQCSGLRATAVISGSRTSFEIDGTSVPVFSSLDAYLATQPDGAIYILTPNHLHASQSIAAMQAQLHVLCEKPMAITVRECDDMLSAAKRHARVLQIAHVLRHSPAMALVKRWIEDGRIGDVREANAAIDFDLPPAARPWAQDPAIAGGGVLMDVGVHCIDLFHWLFRGPLVAKAADFNRPEPTALDTAARVSFGAGAVECAVHIQSARPYRSHLVVVGSAGTITVPSFSASWGTIDVIWHGNDGATETVTVDADHNYLHQLQAFAGAVHRAHEHMPGYDAAEDAAAAVGLVQSFYDKDRVDP